MLWEIISIDLLKKASFVFMIDTEKMELYFSVGVKLKLCLVKIHLLKKKGKSEGFDSCDQPRNLAQNWIQIFDFSARVTFKFDG